MNKSITDGIRTKLCRIKTIYIYIYIKNNDTEIFTQ